MHGLIITFPHEPIIPVNGDRVRIVRQRKVGFPGQGQRLIYRKGRGQHQVRASRTFGTGIRIRTRVTGRKVIKRWN